MRFEADTPFLFKEVEANESGCSFCHSLISYAGACPDFLTGVPLTQRWGGIIQFSTILLVSNFMFI